MSDPINPDTLNTIEEGMGVEEPISATGISAINMMFSKSQRGVGKNHFKKKYKIFRRMKTWGALKLAQNAHALPMRSANILVKKRNEDIPDEWIDFVKKSFVETLYPRLIKNISLWSPYYGVAEFERIWDFVDGNQYDLSGQVAVYKKLKYLQPEEVLIAQDRQTQEFDGLIVFPDTKYEVSLDRVNSYIYTWDEEASENGMYGTSMNDHLIEWYDGFESIIDQYSIYLNKNTGASPTITYPEGKSTDANGTEIESWLVAQRLAETVHRNLPVIIPSNMSAMMGQILQNNQNINPSMLKDLEKWKIEMNESSGSASPAFLDGLRYYDHQAFHQWLILPRAVEEGKFGTKAESGEHKDLMMQMSKVSLQEILQQMSETLIADLLEVNFGPEARGAIFLEAEAIDPSVIAFQREIVKGVLTNPMADFDENLDVPEMLDSTGVPSKSDEEIEENLLITKSIRDANRIAEGEAAPEQDDLLQPAEA